MPGVYRLEYASSRRAGCRNAECKKADIKIDKHELRFGTLVPFDDKQNWHWKHWGCTTPQQITSLKGVIEGNLEYLDGYEDLTFDDQVKVQRALENGHIDDEDWKGDVERNRPGKKGFRTPAYILQQQSEEANNGDGSPSKPTPKKRVRGKVGDNGVEDEVEKPAGQKSKASSQKTKKGKAEEAGNELGDEVPPPKKARFQRKKVKEEDGSEIEAPPPKKARSQNKRIKAGVVDEASAVEDEAPDETPMLEAAPKRTRLPRKAAVVKVVKEEDDTDELDEEMVEEAPKSKPGRKKASANGAVKTAKAVTKGGVTDVEGAKKATAKGPRTKAA